VSESKLPKDITTQELMALDYRYNFSDKELADDWKKLLNVTEFKKGAQFKPGMKLCQHYCDNFWNIQNDKGKSFATAWKDYDVMNTVREWGLQGMSNLWMSWIRRAVFMCAGLPNSSFYRPHFTKQVTMMTGKKQGTLFDPCMGWGGRMLGTIANDWNYISCDPNKETFDNVNKILSFVQSTNMPVSGLSKVELYNIPAEEYDFANSQKVDVVLTSPPYFNLEVYNDDENQSYNKFDNYENWRDNWFFPLVENCFTILKDDGISAWNVMNFKKYDLVGDLIEIHKQHGWTLTKTVGFESPLNNIRKLKNKDVTYIFQKV
jgi:hypothetical protein